MFEKRAAYEIMPSLVGSERCIRDSAHIGRIVRMCWGGEIKKAALYMRGSFASTGAGHGTDKALVAGLMGMAQDDPGIRRAFELAREAGMEFEFHIEEVVRDAAREHDVVLRAERLAAEYGVRDELKLARNAEALRRLFKQLLLSAQAREENAQDGHYSPQSS